MDYKIELDVYAGPLDLLLYLIRRDEIDIYDIPIARITAEYVDYLDVMSALDINVAGDFVVMAATLIELKSRLLLPVPPVEEGEEEVDPRLALVQQLLEYKKFRDAAEKLEGRLGDRQLMFRRGADERRAVEEDSVDIGDVSVWDLFGAFEQILSQVGADKSQMIFDDELPVSVHMEQILNLLQSIGEVSFFTLFQDATSRSMLVSVFLAILELVRLNRIGVSQPAPFGDIFLTLRDDAPSEGLSTDETGERDIVSEETVDETMNEQDANEE